MGYTKEKLERMYNNYERVRMEGRFNMFSKEAQLCTGLNRDEYVYVMEHYSDLKTQFGGK